MPGTQIIGEVTIQDVSTTPIPIYSFSFGAAHSGSTSGGGGGGAGKASFSDVSFTKLSDVTSGELLIDTATGKHLKTAQITIFQAGTTVPEAVYELSDILVTSFSSGANAGGVQVEAVTLNFSRIVFGGQCFDVKANAKC